MPSEAMPRKAITLPQKPVSLARYLVVIALFLATSPLVTMATRDRAPGTFEGPIGLASLPRQVAEWKGPKDDNLDAISLTELKPDDYLARNYRDPSGIPLNLMVIYGHRKQTFHNPGFCLPGGGWQIASKAEEDLKVGDTTVPMGEFLIERQFEEGLVKQVVLYAFLQGDRSTPSIVRHNMHLLEARIRHRRATGAFLRVIVPVVSTEDVARARAKDFITRIYPDLRKHLG